MHDISGYAIRVQFVYKAQYSCGCSEECSSRAGKKSHRKSVGKILRAWAAAAKEEALINKA
jgi:hypothetical protein